jgi:hypothetical protein
MSTIPIPAPSIKLSSFACPHCGAHATQSWFNLRIQAYSGKNPVPLLFSSDAVDDIEAASLEIKDLDSRKQHERMASHFRRLLQATPFFGEKGDTIYSSRPLENVFVSQCYTCSSLALWLHDRLIYPSMMTGPSPNPDLSADVMRDYEEARSILDISPRGAAALLRLCVEKICNELGAHGKDINEKIAHLVSQGLPTQVQQALDAVRVIGNEAVHPGKMDLRDDRDTASQLFGLVNFIVEDRISRPKQITNIYEMIPQVKRDGIAKRDAKES